MTNPMVHSTNLQQRIKAVVNATSFSRRSVVLKLLSSTSGRQQISYEVVMWLVAFNGATETHINHPQVPIHLYRESMAVRIDTFHRHPCKFGNRIVSSQAVQYDASTQAVFNIQVQRLIKAWKKLHSLPHDCL